MTMTAVDVQGVSKRFRLHHEKYTTLKERIIHAGRIPYEDLWALHEVDFNVKEGETIGILGRNGSGKSTLLKCICGVLQPTKGQVVVRGNLAGLLELGAGFQQELSGRDNIYLNGSLLGLSKKEVDQRFDDIVEFAELGSFIDNQVKFYSSGMYVRLGFAVAVNVDPDVLVVDEVLAVGDERFQRKCMEKIKTFQKEGRTIIFVTHAAEQVRSICDRALVLGSGHMLGLGTPGEAIRLFREHLIAVGDVLGHDFVEPGDEPIDESIFVDPNPTGGARPIRITGVEVEYPETPDKGYLLSSGPLKVKVGYKSNADMDAVFKIELRDAIFSLLYASDSEIVGQHVSVREGNGVVEFLFPSIPFLEGSFIINTGVSSLGGMLFDWKEEQGHFEVVNPGRTSGAYLLPVKISVHDGESVTSAS